MKSRLNPCDKASFYPSIPQWKLHIPAPSGAHEASAASKFRRWNSSQLPLSFGKQRDAGTASKGLREQELGLTQHA